MEAHQFLKMQVIKSLEEDILPDFFKGVMAKGKSYKTHIQWPLFMPKNPLNLQKQLPEPTYKQTY